MALSSFGSLCRQVMQALGSCMTNKYSEGRPNARYYGGNEFIDQVEDLCEVRAPPCIAARCSHAPHDPARRCWLAYTHIVARVLKSPQPYA